MAGAAVEGEFHQELDRYLLDTAGPKRAHLYCARTAHSSDRDLLAQAMTDAAFLRGCVRFSEMAHSSGAHAWCFQVNWSPTGPPLGACHCIELPLVFGTRAAWSNAPMLAGVDPAELDGLSELVRSSWLQFATTGSPQRALPWPETPEQRQTMLFDRISGVVGDPAGATWRL